MDAQHIASAWLTQYSQCLSSNDIEGATNCFTSDGWLRDILVFTWDNRTLHGREKILSYLRENLTRTGLSNLTLEEGQPKYLSPQPSQFGVSFGIAFRTALGPGRGYVNLKSTDDGWKAINRAYGLEDLEGYEEAGPELGVYGNHDVAWEDVNRARRAEIESDPYVLIGKWEREQCGLVLGARFRQMGIKALLIDKLPRVGDSWRVRHPTLTLHTPRSQHQLLYQPFPSNWPLYTSRDKMGNWLQQYAINQDLVVWTNSQIAFPPSYDADSKKWTVTIDQCGAQQTVHPSHIVCAAGIIGEPYFPEVPGSDAFQGTIIHTGTYPGGAAFAGKRVVVVGAGNTSADFCQDLVAQGAQSVTMVQRSKTCVVGKYPEYTKGLLSGWPDDVPVDVSDLKFAAVSLKFARQRFAARAEELAAVEKELHEGLTKAGLKVYMGEDGSGQLPLVYEKLGGFWVDVGCADLIIAGKVKVKQGVEIAEYEKNTVVFTDGSTLDADAVIYATGYRNIRESMRKVFGNKIIDRTGEVWGLDEEGELKGSTDRLGILGFGMLEAICPMRGSFLSGW
ncbi:FAD/NAD-P-binding domain-containing protein [Hymenopellis radicata]|nr:FAD/NAD-P-binding domain-containing protein [Hymenopellis radicata]